jgi:hypothetical protein
MPFGIFQQPGCFADGVRFATPSTSSRSWHSCENLCINHNACNLLRAQLKIAVAVVYQYRLFLAARLRAAMVPERLPVGKAQHKTQVSAFQKGSGKRYRP